MSEKKSSQVHRSVQTASGRISYTEQGTGPVALFVHGVLLNGYLWRHQLDGSVRHPALHRRGPARAWRHRNHAGPGRIRHRQCEDAQGVSRCFAHRSGGSRRQRQRRRHCADFRRACTRSAFAASHSLIAILTTTGRPRLSSLSSRWRRPAVYAEHWKQCCRIRVSIARRRLSDRRMNIPEQLSDDDHRNVFASVRQDRATHARSATLSRRLRQQTYARHRSATENAESADAHRLGNG